MKERNEKTSKSRINSESIEIKHQVRLDVDLSAIKIRLTNK